ncbi:MAG: substrate-binding domain-containing protein [Selenomonadaceae bacterium]
MEKKYSQIEILEIVESEDDDILAFEVTNRLLQTYPELDALFITAGGVYGACRAVLSQMRQKHIKIVSFDSAPNTVEMLKQQVIDVTIYQHPYTQGQKAMQMVFSYLVNGLDVKKEKNILKNEIKVLENL